MKGRRFVWRWALRVLQREWRQHLVIFVFISLGVAASVAGALAAYNMVEPPESSFGNGQFSASTSDSDALEASLRSQEIAFARIETAAVGRDGSTERVTIKSIDSANPVSAPLFRLLDGAWPEGPGEVALTDRAVSDPPSIGSTLQVDGVILTVVGNVENPTALSDEFAVVSELRQLPSTNDAVTIDFLIDEKEDRVDFSAVRDLGISSSEGPPARTAATLLVNVVSAFGMLEVGLLVGSSFAVIARRRSRQYGLLAAAGAPPALIRSAAAGVGAILGLVGSLLGLTIGVVVTSLLLPAMESSVGHRISISFPLWATVPSVMIGVGVATFSARRPAVALTKLSIVEMLSSTRPRPEPAGRAAIVGVVLSGVGGTCLVAGFTQLNTMLALVGTLLTPVGLLLLAPLVVHAIGLLASHMPLAERLTGRTIARHNRRSAAVVAALALALAIPIGIAVVTTSIDQRALEAGPNLAVGQVIIWAEGADGYAPRTPAAVDQTSLEGTKNALRAAAPELQFLPIEVAVPLGAGAEIFEEGIPETPIVAAISRLDAECTFCDLDSYGFREAASGEEISYEAKTSWVASPALMRALELETDWLDAGATALVRSDEIKVAWYEGILAEGDDVEVSRTWPENGSIPSAFFSPRLVTAEQFEILTVGWLGTSDSALSADTRKVLRDTATGSVVLEFHETPEPRSTLRTAALLIGLIGGLGLTVSAVGLLSAELANDRSLLASLGARPATGRRMSAAAAALLASAGAMLAIVIGYVPLLPMVVSEGDNFPFVVPWLSLGGMAILFPATAAVVGWLMSRGSAAEPDLRQSI